MVLDPSLISTVSPFFTAAITSSNRSFNSLTWAVRMERVYLGIPAVERCLTSSNFRRSLITVPDSVTILQNHGIQPSAQRVAVADYVLQTVEHPSADLVWNRVKARVPYISRATVYNTLNLFVEKGLLRALTLAEDSVVFDPNVERHHHLVDEESGTIHDIPWDKVQVCNIEALKGFEVHDYQVVMHGVRKGGRRKA